MKNNYATIPWIFIIFLTVISVPNKALATPVLGFNAQVQAEALQVGFPLVIDGTNGYVYTQAYAEAESPTDFGYAISTASVGDDSALGAFSYAISTRGVNMQSQGSAYVYNELYVGGSGSDQAIVEIALDVGGVLEGTGSSMSLASIFAEIILNGSNLTPDYDNAYIVTPSGRKGLDEFETLPFSLTPLGPGTNYTLSYEDSVDNTEGMVEIDLALIVPFLVDQDSVIQAWVSLISDSMAVSGPGCVEHCPTALSSFGSTLEYQAFSPEGVELSWGSESTDVGRPTLSRNLSAVPVPAAVWLFGSGLIGLIGMARRKVRV